MANDFDVQKQFVDNYKDKLSKVLAEAIKEATEQLGETVYIGIWPESQGNKCYFGKDCIFSLEYELGELSKKKIVFHKIESYINWYIKSHIKFLEDLAKRQNRTTLKEIAKEQEIDIKGLETILKKKMKEPDISEAKNFY